MLCASKKYVRANLDSLKYGNTFPMAVVRAEIFFENLK